MQLPPDYRGSPFCARTCAPAYVFALTMWLRLWPVACELFIRLVLVCCTSRRGGRSNWPLTSTSTPW